MNFKNMNDRDKETALMPLILTALQKLGGEASRNDVRTAVAEMNDDIASYAAITRHGKTGDYRPFDFKFNFAVKTLAYAGYLTYSRSQPLRLTDKGIDVNPNNIDFENDVYAISDPLWKKKSQANAERRKLLNGSEMDEDTSDIDDEFEVHLLSAISSMSPKKFETLARRVLTEMGVRLDESKGMAYSGDGGIDGYGYHLASDFRTSRVAIQAKRWQGKVSSPEIDKFRGAMDKFRADYGIFITNSDFTRDAVDAAREGTHMITLIDGNKLVEFIKKHEIYVKPVTTYVLDSFFTGEED